MAITSDKYDKIQKALGFLSQNEAEARAEMGDQKFDGYMGQLRARASEFEGLRASEGELGTSQELEAAKRLVAGKTFGVESARPEMTRERDTMIAEKTKAPTLEGGEPAVKLMPTLPDASKQKSATKPAPAPVAPERQVAAAVEGASGGPGVPEEPIDLPEGEPGAEPVETDVGALLAERETANELVAQREAELKDPNALSASKVKALYAPPSVAGSKGHGPGQSGNWFEPTIEEFREDMRHGMGDTVDRLDENSSAFKEYADARWKEAHDAAVAGGYSLRRVDYDPSMDTVSRGFQKGADVAGALLGSAEEAATFGAGTEAAELIDPGARQTMRATQRRHPVASTLGYVAGALSPGGLANMASKGAVKLGADLAPRAAREVAKRFPVLAGAGAGAAAGAVGAGVQSAGTEAAEMARAERPASLEGAVGTAKRAAGAALAGGLIGAPVGGALGFIGKKAKQLRTEPSERATDLRRIEDPEFGGGTSLLGGVRPPPAVKALRERAAAAKPKSGTKLTDEQLLTGEIAEDVRKYGAGKTAAYKEAEGTIASNIEASAAQEGGDYESIRRRAEDSVRGYSTSRTADYDALEARNARELEDYIRERRARLEQTETELTRDVAEFGTEASREYERTMGTLVDAVGRGARKEIATAREAVARMNADYYRSPQGKERKPVSKVVEQWLGALRSNTDEFGDPSIGVEEILPRLQAQAKKLFAADSRVVVQTPEEAASASARLTARAGTDGRFGKVRVLPYKDAKRLGMIDEATEIGDPGNAKVVIQERQMNARELDRYQKEFRDWSGIEEAQGRKYPDLEGIDPAIHRSRVDFQPSSDAMAAERVVVERAGKKPVALTGWAATKYRESQLLQRATDKAQAAGLPSGPIEGSLDFNARKGIRGRIKEAEQVEAPPELQELIAGEGATGALPELNRLKAQAGNVGVQLPMPENLSGSELEALKTGVRGKVRQGIASPGEVPDLESIAGQRGRLPQLREAREIEGEARRLGVTGASREGPVDALGIVRGHTPETPNPELRRIVPKLPHGAEFDWANQVKQELAQFGLKPEFRGVETPEQLKSISKLIEDYSTGKLPEREAQRIEDLFSKLWGAQGYRIRGLQFARESLGRLGLPPDFMGGFSKEQGEAIRTLIRKYSRGELLPETASEVASRGWITPSGVRALRGIEESRKELGGLGLKPDIGDELTPGQAKQVQSLIGSYGKGTMLEPTARRLEGALGGGEAAARLKLLPPTMATRRLEGVSSMRLPLTATPSGGRIAFPLGGTGLRLRLDAAGRLVQGAVSPGGAGAAAQARERQPKPAKGGRLDPKTMQNLLRIRAYLEGAPDARSPL